jgi:hypothetical protein
MLVNSDVPIDAVMPSGAQTVLTILSGLIAAAVLWYAIAVSKRRGDLLAVYIFLGSGLAVFYEPLGDLLAQVYYSERGQWTWISAFGHGIPVFIGLLYFWYMSLGALWLLGKSRTGVTAKQWWTAWSGYLVFAIVLEFVAAKGLANGKVAPWIYYGDQPFVVLNVPFFTPWTYGPSIDTAVAVGAITAARLLPSGRQWLVLPMVPLFMLAGHLMSAFPSVLALHSTHNVVLSHLGALGTAAAALLISYLGSEVFRRPWEHDPSGIEVAISDMVTPGR